MLFKWSFLGFVGVCLFLVGSAHACRRMDHATEVYLTENQM